MTDRAAADDEQREQGAPPAGPSVAIDPVLVDRVPTSIVPRASIAGRSLVVVVAIMSFLASLTLGVVVLVGERANAWSSGIASEVTVQVRPADGWAEAEMNAALASVVAVLEQTPGVRSAEVQSVEDAAALLEPWLGTGFDPATVPLPRLVAVRLDRSAPSDLVALALAVQGAVPQASLDDHRVWVSRLTRMAGFTVVIGAAILLLMLAATALIVVFATRAAMAGNRHIVEVLHFVGADETYIAAQFQNHFLLLGLRGAVIGGVLGLASLWLVGFLSGFADAALQNQVGALVGPIGIGAPSVIGNGLLVLIVAILTALTSRATVLRTLERVD